MPQAHLVACLKDEHDIINPNQEDLIIFVNRYFSVEMSLFEGDEHQNVYTKDGDSEYTEEYKHKAGF